MFIQTYDNANIFTKGEYSASGSRDCWSLLKREGSLVNCVYTHIGEEGRGDGDDDGGNGDDGYGDDVDEMRGEPCKLCLRTLIKVLGDI